MIDSSLKSQCCGCTACMSVCPKNAIKMICDEKGFLYPQVDSVLCTNCGLCDRSCAFKMRVSEKKTESTVKKAYAVKLTDKKVLSKSTSGGMFSAVSDCVLDVGGVVYGVAYDNDFNVVHIRATSEAERNRCRGSKYVQSDLTGTFNALKEDLYDGKKVLFTGTPCQADGLRAFLNKDYDNLIICELICNGVPSPKIWKDNIDFLEKKYKSPIKAYFFRPKKWGWHIHNEIAEFENGKVYHSNECTNLFKTLYYSRLVHRPSCGNCPYTNLNRRSDLTIGDCRGIDDILPDFGSFEGVSLVTVNTKKGVEVFSQCQGKLVTAEVDISKFLQIPLKKSVPLNNNSKEFWKAYEKNGYIGAVKHCFGKHYFIKQKIKKLLRKA